jgi:hypothetical protein
VRGLFALALLALACAGSKAERTPEASRAPVAGREMEAPLSAPRSGSESTSQAPAAQGAAAPRAEAQGSTGGAGEAEFPFEVERVLDAGIVALSVERAPHVAALSANAAFVHTGKGWQEVPLPAHPHLAREGAVRELFYGRDYRPRLVVNVETERGPDRSYFRLLPGGFRSALDELGPLARKPKPLGQGGCSDCFDNRLVAVLGNEDPEIICRPRDVCVVKRVTGWATLPAPEDVRHAAIFGGKAYLLAGKALLSVEGDKTLKVLSEEGPWSLARGLVLVDGAPWVLDTGAVLHRFDGKSYRSFMSPVGPPRALFGESEGELWVGGQGGLARFDGERFVLIPSQPGDVTVLGGRGRDELWIGGSGGLRYAKRRR